MSPFASSNPNNAPFASIETLLHDPTYMKKKLTLSDGRILSYSQVGDIANGIPVLFQIGLMGSSVVGVLLHEAGLERGLHIIMLDFPGIGESTPLPNRTLEQWPRDVEEALNFILKSESASFALWGHSAGGHHAMAVLQDEVLQPRIRGTLLAAPWIPFDDLLLIRAVRLLPGFVKSFVLPNMITGGASSGISSATYLPHWMVGLNPEFQSFVKVIHSYTQYQGRGGINQTVRLSTQSHAIVPENITSPIVILCGTNDFVVTPSNCERIQHELNQCGCTKVRFERLDGETHESIVIPRDFERLGENKCLDVLAGFQE